MTTLVTSAFLLALAFSLALRLYLAWRHIRHVRAHRDAVPAAFTGRFTLADHQLAADYTVAKTRLAMLSAVVDAGVLLALTLGGGIEALTTFWLGLGWPPVVSGTALILSLMAVTGLVGLPFGLYATFGIEARFGFNKTSVRLFIIDQLKSLLVGLVLGVPLLLLVLWLMYGSTLWWLWVWLVWSAFSLLMVWLFPTVIAPLFNRFLPLEDGELKQRIDALLTRCGFRSSGVFVVDGSRRSNHGNAYFTGFGAAKRIVFYDTLLNQLDGDEIEAVLAHELGHFKRRHIIKRIVLTFALSFAFLLLLGWLLEWTPFYLGLGITTPTLAAGLILAAMALPAFTFPLTPLMSRLSRRQEFEADAYAAEHADRHALVSALTRLYRDNASTLTPDPLHSAFYDSHPPATIRIQHLESLPPTGVPA